VQTQKRPEKKRKVASYIWWSGKQICIGEKKNENRLFGMAAMHAGFT